MYSNLDKEIIHICHYEYNNFLKKVNVVGVGYGYKYRNNMPTNEKVLQVFVEKKVPLSCLYEKDYIPSFYKNIKTDVIEAGSFTITALTDKVRPVAGGYDIGPAGIIAGGTYGGLVKDADGYYMLSNNHTIAANNLVPLGNPILQPGTFFGGESPEDRVAELSRFIPINFITGSEEPVNYVDCAIAKVNNLDLVSPEIKFIGTPKGKRNPELFMATQGTGETSGLFFGVIVSLHVTTTIKYDEVKSALFKDQIFITPPNKKGDSGALILDDENYVVGLNFASSPQYSVANPIDTVLKALKVQLVIDK